MKKKRIELDVDFIGEQGRSLTEDESKAISDFIKAQKAKAAKTSAAAKKRVAKRKDIIGENHGTNQRAFKR